MGVTGLWRLIEPAGKPVPIETLENKVLAVDISIWLHQMVKGFQDAKGAPMPNAHLLGLFQRLCKLLYYRIKPVFVFDGGFPDLKKETIAKRNDNKAKFNSESERLKREIVLLLGKKTAIGSLLGKETLPKKASRSDKPTENDDLFKLPEVELQDSSEESESEDEDISVPVVDLHSIDLESENFKNLPSREKYEVLIELKETRKMNSWGKLHELPKDSDNFSSFQMKRLLKRRKVQECLEETEKEVGGNSMTLNELESLLNEEGINTNMDRLPTKRIAGDDRTRYLMISNVKQALEDARKKEKEKASTSKSENFKCELAINNNKECEPTNKSGGQMDEDLQKAIQMSLECVGNEYQPKNDTNTDQGKDEQSSDSTFMIDSDYSEASEEDVNNFDFNAAKAFIMQNTDFTTDTITHIVSKSARLKIPKPKDMLDEVLKELDIPTTSAENSGRLHYCKEKFERDVLDLSSSDDDECITINKNSVVDMALLNPEKETVVLDSGVEENAGSNLAERESIVYEMLEKCEADTPTHSVSLKKYVPNCEEEMTESNSQALPPRTGCSEAKKNCDSVIDVKNVNLDKEAILLDSTVAYNYTLSEKSPDKYEQRSELLLESSDSDEDFEEVLDSECNARYTEKPIVEVNLELKDALEEDIFADVFETECEKPNISDEIILLDKTVHVDITSCKLPKTTLETESKGTAEKFPLAAPETAEELIVNRTEELIKVTGNNDNSTVTEVELDSKVHEEKAEREILTTEQLNTMSEQLETEAEDLLREKSRLERMGRNITEQMTQDAQELLKIFGIPYIVAPCEAEAQCAFLETVKLTDGTITDDSDIWLFGGKTVYKNFFNQKKLVMQYLFERIDKSYNLSREQLILLALLVGSDYTTGVSGVGPVTAMEILASFSCTRKDLLLFQVATNPQAKYAALLTGLQNFKNWLRSSRRTDDSSLKKKLKNISVTDDFPSMRVVQAYMEPKIDTNKEKFTWGVPDVTVLRDYVLKKFGWSKNKLEAILDPVLKRFQDKNNQRTMQDYFQRRIEFQSLEEQMSKRVKAAVEKMGCVGDSQIMKPPSKELRKTKPLKKAKVKNKCIDSDKSKSSESNISEASTSNEIVKVAPESAVTVSGFDIVIPKLDRYQEIIPQREKDKMNILKTKLKAIETYRKTILDKKAAKKRKSNLPKDHAELSESSDSS